MRPVSRLAALRSRPFACLPICLSHPRGYSQSAGKHEPDHSASAKLFRDAARDEAAEEDALRKSSVVSALGSQNENWTGDEPVEHAVLRMLVDKYKPMRAGPVRSAEEKLKTAPPQIRADATPREVLIDRIERLEDEVSASDDGNGGGGGLDGASSSTSETPVRRYVPGEPILPGIPGHQPWHTTFTVPSHATSSVRYGNIPPPRPAASGGSPPLDDKARRRERETKKRMQQGARLVSARESTIDYRLGLKGGAADQLRRPNPVSLKGWASLVEDRIEKARQAGHFRNIKGRGQPIARVAEDKNPFIGREEFLMNRIVQRQGAAPPWIEIQTELETAVNTFREVLKQSWTRRALRTLTAMHPASLLPKLSLTDVTALRDAEWEAKERTYHETALEEVNALVRKYNGLAPYAVRRAYYMRTAELDRVYREAGEDILRGLSERAQQHSDGPRRRLGRRNENEAGEGGGDDSMQGPLRLWDMFREMFVSIRRR